jgi:hypothetical protein
MYSCMCIYVYVCMYIYIYVDDVSQEDIIDVPHIDSGSKNRGIYMYRLYVHIYIYMYVYVYS